MSEQEQQAISEGSIGQSASTGGLGAWLPIETVPTDVDVLVIGRTGNMSVRESQFIRALIVRAEYEKDECFYTHWMPLPEAPNAKVSRSAPLLAQVGSTDGLERG